MTRDHYVCRCTILDYGENEITEYRGNGGKGVVRWGRDALLHRVTSRRVASRRVASRRILLPEIPCRRA